MKKHVMHYIIKTCDALYCKHNSLHAVFPLFSMKVAQNIKSVS